MYNSYFVFTYTIYTRHTVTRIIRSLAHGQNETGRNFFTFFINLVNYINHIVLSLKEATQRTKILYYRIIILKKKIKIILDFDINDVFIKNKIMLFIPCGHLFLFIYY